MEKKETITSVTFILSGSLLQMFNGIGNGWISTLTAIFGLILFFMGLSKLKKGIDEKGQAAVKMLIIAAILGLIGLVLDLIPLIGIVASIVFIAAFIVQLIGVIKLKSSESIGESGKSGVTLLLIAMILAIIQSIFGFVPLAGGIIAGIISFIALILVFFGWLKIQDGIIINNS
ncbi:MAG: hypothetical protein K9G58_03765 [Bacteroidales bacterium]|nr:hypothetical protein [Bacteroidales bacterium]MCF8386739.1 hypothetical protein [Bacteroidales bacterium]MCF8397261.1 hypothetical protein [Bacteroidales bacterium]